MQKSYSPEEVRVMSPDDVLVALMSQPEDVYALYTRLRETDPTYASPQGIRFFTRYHDIHALMRSSACHQADADDDHRYASSAWLQARPSTLLFANPPTHTRMRSLVSRAFTVKSVEALRPRVQEFVDRHLDRLGERDVFDLAADLGDLLPTEVITAMLGVAPEDRGRMAEWAPRINAAASMWCDDETLAAADEAVIGFMELIDGLLEEKRRHPGEDILTVMLQAEDADQRLSAQEIKCLALTLLVAGTETSTHLISSGLVHLLRHPAELEKIRNDPSLVRAATDEVLRFDGPVNVGMIRVAMEDTTINGLPVPKGEQMCGFLGAGNRDPEVYPEPDRLWIDRPKPKPHLTFGTGPHVCLGAALARIEFEVVVRTLLLDRFPNLRLVPDEPIEYLETFPPLRGVSRAIVETGRG